MKASFSKKEAALIADLAFTAMLELEQIQTPTKQERKQSLKLQQMLAEGGCLHEAMMLHF